MTNEAILLAAMLAAAAAHAAPVVPDAAIECGDCDAWNEDVAPFRIFGDTYYVGVAGVSAVLVTSADGHVLFDGGLPQSAPLIERHVRALGFRVEDIRVIANSHAHFDHAGGIAALARASGARVLASERGAQALRSGELPPDDPQHAGDGFPTAFPPVARVAAVADGETVVVGTIALTAHLTPGHTPGSTTWTWRSCESDRCLHVVYGDSLNAVSLGTYRFSGDATHADVVPAFRESIAKVAALPCDILLTVHPGFARTLEKQAALEPGDANPFVDARACRAYAEAAGRRLEQRIAQEHGDAKP